MREIPLTKGYTAVVDDADFDWLSQWSWSYATGYAVRGERTGGRQRLVKMHREILGLPRDFDGREGDHKNGNRADNRRENLRIVTVAQNRQNRRLRVDSTTGVRGVTRIPSAQGPRYKVRAWVDGRRRTFGSYATLEEAAMVAREVRLRHMPGALS